MKMWRTCPKRGWYLRLTLKTKEVHLLNVLANEMAHKDSWDINPGVTGAGAFEQKMSCWHYSTQKLENFSTYEGEYLWHPMSPTPEEHEDFENEENYDD